MLVGPRSRHDPWSQRVGMYGPAHEQNSQERVWKACEPCKVFWKPWKHINLHVTHVYLHIYIYIYVLTVLIYVYIHACVCVCCIYIHRYVSAACLCVHQHCLLNRVCKPDSM